MPAKNSRRKNSKSSWTRGKRNNEVAGCTALMLNPFSNASVIPRIPDGKPTYSTGFREQTTAELLLTVPHYVLLFPSVKVPMLMFKKGDTAVGELTLGEAAEGVTLVDSASQAYSTTFSTNVELARIVSQGLSIKCTSNAQYNDGYFEAIRLSSTSLKNEKIALSTLPNNPSYVHGKLRDIESYSFQLKPVDEHHFGDPSVQSQELTNQKQILDDMNVDSSFDAILIKLVPGPELKTSLFFHTVTNFEVVYDESSEMAKFMTSAPKDLAAVERVRSILTSNNKAARSIYHAR